MKRLVERFVVGSAVQIQFQGDVRWLSGRVVAHQHPGVWVALDNEQRYFVTNSTRIRANCEPTYSQIEKD